MPVAREPFDLANLPILEQAFEAFGPSRMMWGSDYPAGERARGLRERARADARADRVCGRTPWSAVFGGTAARVFGIGVGAP